jgi:hypothetical protein
MDNKITKSQAIRSLDSTAEYSIRENVVTWDKGFVSDADIQTEVTRLQAEYDNKQYARDRAELYPSIADQLDDIYHNGVAGWKTSIKAIKDQFPKG